MHIYEALYRVERVVYCFHQACSILHQSMVLVYLCFYGLKPLCHKQMQQQSFHYISATLCLCILQILQVNKRELPKVSAYTLCLRDTEHFLQKADKEKFDTTAELNERASGANKGKTNQEGTEMFISLEVRKEKELHLLDGGNSERQ